VSSPASIAGSFDVGPAAFGAPITFPGITADVILALRCDLSETHPVVKSEVVLAVKRQKAKLIVVNSRNIYLNKFSTLNLLVKPGTEAALINGILQTILEEKLAKEDFIQARTEGLDSLRPLLQGFSPEHVSSRTGVAAAALREAARIFAGAKKAVILSPPARFRSKRCGPRRPPNLALLTGRPGKRARGLPPGEKTTPRGPGYGGLLRASPWYADLGTWERRRSEQS
jgi:formate dehydrogenase major subunit